MTSLYDIARDDYPLARKAALYSIRCQQQSTWYWQQFNSGQSMTKEERDGLIKMAAIQDEIAQIDYLNER